MKFFKRNVNNEALPEEQISSLAKSMIGQLGYPCKVYGGDISYEELIKQYTMAVERGKKEGFVPVLVPVDEVLDEYFGILKDDEYKLEDILKNESANSAAYGKEFLHRRYKEYMKDYEEDGFDMNEFLGQYEGEPEEIREFTAVREFDSNKLLETILFEVPTTNPWELVAYVPFGGWNECPAVEDMMAVCKYWYMKYGAVPVTITHDVMEMQLPAGIVKREAVDLAKEHYAFTSDRVDQCTGSGTLTEVADSLAVSKIWYFWWD